MSTTLYVVDAFTAEPFAGNPAAVCILEEARDEKWMQLVAREMHLSETAFLRKTDDGWSLRWFTPTVEVSLCGHATLASAFVLWKTDHVQANEEVRFLTQSGWLTCRRIGDWIEMDFPAQRSVVCPMPNAPLAGLQEALGCELLEVRRSAMDVIVEVADEETLQSLRPNLSLLGQLPVRGVIVTSRSTSAELDFQSRFFAPSLGIPEDPVTGSAHCALAPYWQEKLGKDKMVAKQTSARGGIVKVQVLGDRVLLQGQAVLVSRVEMFAS